MDTAQSGNDIDEALKSANLIQVQIDTDSVKDILNELLERLKNQDIQINVLQEQITQNNFGPQIKQLQDQLESLASRSSRLKMNGPTNMEEFADEFDAKFDDIKNWLTKTMNEYKAEQKNEITSFVETALDAFKKENLQLMASTFPSMSMYNSLLARVEDLENLVNMIRSSKGGKDAKLPPPPLSSSRANEFLEQLKDTQSELELLKKKLKEMNQNRNDFTSKLADINNEKVRQSEESLNNLEDKMNDFQNEIRGQLKALEEKIQRGMDNENYSKLPLDSQIEENKKIKKPGEDINESNKEEFPNALNSNSTLEKILPLLSQLQGRQDSLEKTIQDQSQIIQKLQSELDEKTNLINAFQEKISNSEQPIQSDQITDKSSNDKQNLHSSSDSTQDKSDDESNDKKLVKVRMGDLISSSKTLPSLHTISSFTPRDHQSFKQISSDLNDTNIKLSELENEVLNIRSMVEELYNGNDVIVVPSNQTIASMIENIQEPRPATPPPEYKENTNSNKTGYDNFDEPRPATPPPEIQQKDVSKTTQEDSPTDNADIRKQEELSDEDNKQDNTRELRSHRTKSDPDLIEKEKAKLNAHYNRRSSKALSQFEISNSSDKQNSESSNHSETEHDNQTSSDKHKHLNDENPIDDITIDNFSKLAKQVAQLEVRVSTLESVSPHVFGSLTISPEDSNSEIKASESDKNSSRQQLELNKSDNSRETDIGTQESAVVSSSSRKGRHISKSVQTYEDTECQVLFTDDRGTSPAKQNSSRPEANNDMQIPSELDDQQQSKSINDDISYNNHSELIHELSKNINDVKGRVESLQEELKQKQNFIPITIDTSEDNSKDEKQKELINNMFNQFRSEYDEKIASIGPKTQEALNSYAPLPLVQKVTEKFQASMDDANRQMSNIKEFLKNLVTRNDLDALIEKLSQTPKAPSTGSTAGATHGLRCLLCGKPTSTVTGMITDSEVAKMLGTPPQCSVSSGRLRNSTNSYVLSYGRDTTRPNTKKRPKLTNLPPMETFPEDSQP